MCLHSKGNYKQGEKSTFRMIENNSKWNNWQSINFQNIEAAHKTQYQKNKQTNKQKTIKKWAKYLNRYFSKEDKQMANKHIQICQYHSLFSSVQFSSVQSLSRVWLFATLWIAARQASLSITNSWSLLKLMSIKLMMPSSHLIIIHY